MLPARKLRTPLLAVITAAALLLTACSGSSSPASGGGHGVTVKTAEFSWTAAKLTNEIIDRIVKQDPALGVAGLSTSSLDPAAAWAGAARGDIDLLTEVALPNQQALADKAKSKVSIVSQTYGDAKQGWFVPAYAVAPGGPAAGLTSIAQLDKYKSVFGGKLYDDDPGYLTTKQNTKRLQGYHVDYQHVIAAEAAELAQLKRAYSRKQPILIYLYHPHAVFSEYDMVQLKEPAPYTDNCLTTGSGACAMPAYSANIALSNSLATKEPKFAALLKHFRVPLAEMEDMLKQIDIDKRAVAAVAADFVTKHRSDIASWTQQA